MSGHRYERVRYRTPEGRVQSALLRINSRDPQSGEWVNK